MKKDLIKVAKVLVLVGYGAFACFIVMYRPIIVHAQSFPGTINLGTNGNSAMYVGPHRIGPGTGSGGGGSSSFTLVTSSGFSVNTNVFGSATNTVNLANADQTFVSPTACSITGVTGKGTTNTSTVTITFSNSSATN